MMESKPDMGLTALWIIYHVFDRRKIPIRVIKYLIVVEFGFYTYKGGCLAKLIRKSSIMAGMICVNINCK